MIRFRELCGRLPTLLSHRTLRGGLDILRSGDLPFFARRLHEILFTPTASQLDCEALSRRCRQSGIEILTPPHTHYIACLIQCHLAEVGITSRVLSTPDPKKITDLHIVICPNVFTRLPRHMVAVQMEQAGSPWFSRRYRSILRFRSLAVLEYAAHNLEFLVKDCSIPYGKLYYFPIGHNPQFLPLHLSSTTVGTPRFDLAFYGAINARRRQILDHLQQHFRVLVLTEQFGPSLYTQLASATAVINIHYYSPALLETTRLHECLALGMHVISEPSNDQHEHDDAITQLVRFIDLDDMAQAIPAIAEALGEIHSLTVSPGENAQLLNASASRSRFYFFRMLLGLGLIDYPTLKIAGAQARIPDFHETLCLSLPETPARRRSAWKPTWIESSFFDGIRHPLGWLGCALSYKYLASQALAQGIERLTIYEDDVDATRLDAACLQTVSDYLDRNEGDWDVFSGLITDLSESARITRIDHFGELTFVHLDNMTGTVFNIYSQRALRIMAEWESPDMDPKLTIDRYLESHVELRVVTTYPFIAGHKEDSVSSLWGFRNTAYKEWITRSEHRLGEKLRDLPDATTRSAR